MATDEILKFSDLRTIADLVIELLCQTLGIEKLSEINLKIEGAGNDIPGQVSRNLEQQLREKGIVRTIIQTLSKDDVACAALNKALEPARRQSRSEADQRRLEKLTEAVLDFYKKRDPDLQPEHVSEHFSDLIEFMDKGRVIQGKQNHIKAVADWIDAQEERMSETIRQITKARTDQELIASFARTLVVEGIDPLPTDVRARIEKETDIKECIRKT